MKKETIINIISGLLYYSIGTIGFFYSFVIGLFGIIPNFSVTLFCIYFLVLPIIILLLPIILKIILKKQFYKSILLSLKVVGVYLILVVLTSISIRIYISNFTPEKWNNEKYSDLRYLMINDLEEKYNLVGMKKEEVIQILGKEYGKNINCIYYHIGVNWLEVFYYYLEYDENDIITKVYVNVD